MVTAILALAIAAPAGSAGIIEEVPLHLPRVSPDGEILLGSTSHPETKPCIWTRAGGIQVLELGLGDARGFVTGASSDGKTFVGLVEHEDWQSAFVWQKEKGTSLICALGANSSPGISSDGKKVFGMASRSRTPALKESAFVWSAETGLRGLQPLKAGTSWGGGVASSADGSVIVGFSDVGPKDPDFRKTHFGSLYREDGSIEGAVWIGSYKPIGIGRPEGFYTTQATDCSSDGSVVIGFGSTKEGDRPFTWTQRTGLQLLPVLDGIRSTWARFISGDGKTIYGRDWEIGAIVWRSDFGVMELAEFLKTNGVDTAGWKLEHISGVSDDGNVIAGRGVNPEGEKCSWVARIQS